MKKTNKIVSVTLALLLTLSACFCLTACKKTKIPPKEQRTFLSVAITSAPTKTAYVVGQLFDKAGMVVSALYSDDTTEAVTDYTYAPTDALTVNDKKITVTYNGKTAEQAITVTAKTLTSITISKTPNKTEYIAGEVFDKTGMEVTATYNDGSKLKPTDFTIEPVTPLIVGTSEIIVYYGGKTASTAITVTEKTVNSIALSGPVKTAYIEGQSFDTTGLIVTASYADGSKKAVSGYTVTPSDALTLSHAKVTITYVGKTAELAITVSEKTLASLSLTGAFKKAYIIGELFDATGMEVLAVYNNGDTIPVAIEECVIDKLGALTALDTLVTVSYLGVIGTAEISVGTLSGISVTMQPNKTMYYVGEIFAPAGLQITGAYTNGVTAVITEGYTFTDSALSKAVTTITISYQTFSATVEIQVIENSDGVILEAESATLTDNSLGNGNIAPKALAHWMTEFASGGTFVSDINKNDKIAFTVNAEKDSRAILSIRGASNRVDVNPPTIVLETMLNKVMTVTVNGIDHPISDTAILPGKDNKGVADKQLWVFWAIVSLGEIELTEGTNTIEFTFINPDDYKQPYAVADGNYFGDAVGQYDYISLIYLQ